MYNQIVWLIFKIMKMLIKLNKLSTELPQLQNIINDRGVCANT